MDFLQVNFKAGFTMPKIFVLRHQLQEQQAKLRQHDKGGESSNSPSLSSDEEKGFEPATSKKQAGVIIQPPVLNLAPVTSLQQPQPEVSDILQRPPPGLVIQPIPPPQPQPQTSVQSTSSPTAGKQILIFLVCFLSRYFRKN